MMIVEAVNSAPTESAVYFLVTAYVESLQHFERGCGVPRSALELPIEGCTDLRRRLGVLQQDSGTDPESAVAVSELAAVIRSALARLATFEETGRVRHGAPARHSARTGSPHSALSV